MPEAIQYGITLFFAVLGVAQIGLLTRIYFLLGQQGTGIADVKEDIKRHDGCIQHMKGRLTRHTNRIRDLEQARAQ